VLGGILVTTVPPHHERSEHVVAASTGANVSFGHARIYFDRKLRQLIPVKREYNNSRFNAAVPTSSLRLRPHHLRRRSCSSSSTRRRRDETDCPSGLEWCGEQAVESNQRDACVVGTAGGGAYAHPAIVPAMSSEILY
jgi:hypothetical protein